MAVPTSPASAIAPLAPEVSLLTAARSLPVDRSSFDSWRSGLSHRETADMVTGRYPGKTLSTGANKTDAQAPTVSGHRPFLIYSHHLCVQPVNEAEIRSEALAKLEATTPYHLAREFWTGSTDTDMLSLMNSLGTGEDITTGTAVAVKDAIQDIVRAYEDASGGVQGMIHVPQEVLWGLADAGMVSRTGNRMLTPHGHIVVAGPGYPGTGDYGPAADTAGAGEAYIYMTGMVEVAVGDPFVKGLESGWNRLNEVEVYAERWAIVRFDTQSVVSANVTF